MGEKDQTIARLMTLASVGTEMAGAIVVGVFLDYWLKTMPGCTIAGALLGLVGGVYHLIVLNRPGKS